MSFQKVTQARSSKVGRNKWKVRSPPSSFAPFFTFRKPFAAVISLLVRLHTHTFFSQPDFLSSSGEKGEMKEKSLGAYEQVSPLRCAARTGKVE